MDDMISRQAAIETVRKAKSIGQAHRMLVQLPSAQPVEDARAMCGECDAWNQYRNYPQPGWIPTSVRLPEDNEEVLFCDNEGERWLGWHYGFWKTERLDFNEDEVVAWMPLPTPYQEGDDKHEG